MKKYVVKNKIPDLLKSRGMSISELHARILTETKERISYQALLELTKEGAENEPLPDGVRVGTLKLIAVVLGVTLNDLAEITEVTN